MEIEILGIKSYNSIESIHTMYLLLLFLNMP